MDEKQAFLQAIIDDPDDDALRLIYADWLDDHGESERAELIRVQCDLASLSISDPRYAQLEDRSDELLFLHEKEWVEIGTVISDLNWSRGFVEDLLLKNGRALEDAQSAFEQHPIRNVFFGPPTQIDPASLLDSPFLDRLRSMSMGFYDPFEMPESLFTLLSSSQVKDLEKLDLSWGQSRDFMTELCKQSNAPRLMHLGLEELSTEDALSVFSPHFERLTDLDSTEGFGTDDLEILLREPNRWTGLGLNYATHSAESLKRLRSCERLERLSLRCLSDEHELALPTLKALTVLTTISDVAPPGIFRAIDLSQMERLKYSWVMNPSRPATEKDWHDLEEMLQRLPGAMLHLELDDFTGAPVAELIRLKGVENIRALTLEMSDVSDAEVDALIECEALTGLRSLSIESSFSAPQLIRFAQAPLLQRVVKMRTYTDDCNDDVVNAYLKSPHLKRMRALILAGGNVSKPQNDLLQQRFGRQMFYE